MTVLKYKVHGEVKTSEEVEPIYFKGDSLGAKFGNTLLGFFRRAINSATGWFEERLVNFAVEVLGKIERSGATVLGALVKELRDKNAIPTFLKPIFDEIENPKGEIGAMFASTAGSTAIGGLFGAIFDPLMAEVKYQLNTWLKPYIPGIGELVMAWRRGDLDNSSLIAWAAANGFSEGITGIFKSLSRNTLDIQTILEARLRDKINVTLENAYLKRLGYDEVDVKVLKDLYMKVPSITESIIANFKADITKDELKEIAYKNGIDEEFLNILISSQKQVPQIGYLSSMFLRGFINNSQVSEKLKAQGFNDDDTENLKKLFYQLPPPADLIQMAVKEAFTPAIAKKFGQYEDFPEDFGKWAEQIGISREWAERYWAAHWQLPAPQQGWDMAHRGIITGDELKMLLRSLDITPFWRDKMIELSDSYLIPPLADLVRMAVREAFTPETAVKFGQYEDLPDEFMTWVKKLGVAEEWGRAYWAAHWDLPSAGMGFDMLHRNIIDHETLVTLLKSLDVMPYWRDKLIQLAYNVYTRVDVRRMHKTGVITAEEVRTAYLEQGYSPDHADKLAQYTIIANMTPDVEFTKSELLDGFKRGIFDESELRTGLSSLGLSDNIINYYIAKAELEKVQESKKTEINYVKTMFQKGGWNVERVNSELGKLGLAAKEMEYYIILWQKEAKTKTTLPTKAELKKWVLSGVIDVDTWYLYMSSLGYNDTVIAWYASDLSTTVETKAKLPSKAELKKWVLAGTIDPMTWYNYMLQLGYSDVEISLYAEEISDAIELKASEG